MERQDVEFRGRVMPGLRVVSTTPVFWDPATGKSARGEKVAGPLTGVQWSKDGTGASPPRTGTPFCSSTPPRGAPRGHPADRTDHNALALSPDGGTVAVGEDDGTVAVSRHRTSPSPAGHTPVWLRAGPHDRVQAVALSPDGGQVVSAHADGTLALWDLRTGRLVKAVRLPASSSSRWPGRPTARHWRLLRRDST